MSKATPIPKNPLDLLIDSLNPALHSGLYYNENHQLCLGSPDSEALKKELSSRNMSDMETFEIVNTKYSIKDLSKAQEQLLEQRELLGISAVGFDILNNGLALFVPDIKTRNSNDFASIVNMPIVIVPDIYVNNKPIASKPKEEKQDLISEKEIQARITLKSGSWLAKSSGNNWCTLGAWALHNNGDVGFVTSAHGWGSIGCRAYSGSTIIGTSTEKQQAGSVDAIFFRKNSNLTWGGYRNGNPIDQISNPRVNDSVTMLGVRGTKTGRVMYINISGNFEDGYFSDMFCYNFMPIAGDSGSAIIARRNSQDVLVGLNKSQWWTDNVVDDNNTTTWGAGSKAFNIDRALDLEFAN